MSLLLSGCSLLGDKSSDAKAIAERVHGMPGVAEVTSDYHSDFSTGSRFRLDVRLADSATSQQGQDVARTALDAIRADKFPRVVELNISYPPKGSVSIQPLDVVGSDPVTADDALPNVALLFDIAPSAVVDSVAIRQPAFDGTAATRDISVRVHQPVDSAAATALQRAHPELADARWVFYNPPAKNSGQPSTFTTTGEVPTPAMQRAWSDLGGLIDDWTYISGSAHPDYTTGAPVIDVEITLVTGDAETLAGTAPRAAAALTALDRPANLTVYTSNGSVEVTVGGCFQHDEGHVPTLVEHQLARQYEKC